MPLESVLDELDGLAAVHRRVSLQAELSQDLQDGEEVVAVVVDDEDMHFRLFLLRVLSLRGLLGCLTSV